MSNPDVSVMIGDTRFNFRVAILIYNQDRVMLHQEIGDTYWNMPGGRVKCGESTAKAIVREVKEELGLDIVEPKLIDVSENFFEFMDRKNHELLFVYRCECDDKTFTSRQDIKGLDNDRLIYHWFKKSEVSSLTLKPEIIYKLINDDVDHLIHNIGH